MPFERKTATYAPKHLDNPTTMAKLKKVLIDLEGQSLVAIYARGEDSGGDFSALPIPDTHISLGPDDLPPAGLSQIKGFLTALHNYLENEGLL